LLKAAVAVVSAAALGAEPRASPVAALPPSHSASDANEQLLLPVGKTWALHDKMKAVHVIRRHVQRLIEYMSDDALRTVGRLAM
jgi:hypothetical protein